MKKSIVFNLLLLVCSGLHGMEAEEKDKPFSFDQLPQELQCEIARDALPDQMEIAPKDAVQDIAEYAHGYEVLSVAVVRDGTQVRSSGSGKAKITDAKSRKLLAEYTHDDETRSVFPDGKREVSGGVDGQVKIANIDSGEVQEYAHDGDVFAVGVFPDGKRVVSGGVDGQVKIANADSGKVLVAYAHDSVVSSVGVFPDGTRVISGGGDEKVKIANADSGKVLVAYAHGSVVTSVGVFPDCKRVVSGGNDLNVSGGNENEVNKVKIANARSGEVQAEYVHDCVSSVAVFPDGTRVVSGGLEDGKVKIKSIVPLLLAMYTLEKPNLDRYRLLKEVQDRLLKEKKPLYIKEEKRAVLEEMPELKKLLKIEKSKTNPIWRLQMKYAPDTDTSGDGKSEG